MKRFLLITIAIFAFGWQNVSAQDDPMSISCSSPDLEAKVKRCVAAGENVYLDILLTNKGDKDIENYHTRGAKVFDSEGNSYEGKISIKIPGKDNYLGIESIACNYARFDMPIDIPRKVSICVAKVDKAASSFPKVELYLGPYAGSAETYKFEIKRIPIKRD